MYHPHSIIISTVLFIIIVNSQGFNNNNNNNSPFLRDGRFGVYHYDVMAMKGRQVQYPIHPMILARRSLREMNGLSISKSTIMSLFEASRWAPSYYNVQSWRYVYAMRDGPYWDKFVDALVPGNQKWARHAAALIVVLSNKYQIRNGEKKMVESHTFDTGASWMLMALEGTARGLVVHPMSGFDREKIARTIGLNSDDYKIEAMVAVGNRVRAISNEKITDRNPIDKFVSEGIFKEKIYE
ncbi:putative NAD(P)H nitroreductase YdgI isoform X2 [Dermatophagoides farinae]|uniref:putative NAD(P)H nitroreductase YdgI isoform X2 n=1 Tax=Dermatophagoides farinae TaxID=6954 RepID=UPI003F5F3828